MRSAPPEVRRAEIDGLRAVAIALVVGYHIAPERLPGGFVGVDLFFVLSGFVITRVLAADRAPGRWRRFYELRLRRLAPALAVTLGSTLALGSGLLLFEAWRQLARHTLAATLFVANVVFFRESGYFDADALRKPLLHLWSLGIEEQFYLFWPPLFWWLLRRPARALPATATLGAASFAACIATVAVSPEAAFYLPWNRFWELLAGAMLAQLPPRALAAGRPRLAHVACAAGTALVFAAATMIDPRQPFPSWSALAPVGGSALLVWGAGESAPARRLLSLRPLVALGLVSYPLYLWHWPLLSFLGELHATPTAAMKLQAAALALALAIVTWLAFERPARAAYAARPRRTTSLLLLALAVPAAWSAWILGRPRAATAPANPGVDLVARALDEDAARRMSLERRPCPSPAELAGRLAPVCFASGAKPDAPALLLWGDSAAESWAPLAYAVAAERGERAVVLSTSGCPPLLGVRSQRFEGCGLEDSAWKLAFIEWLRPARIVIAARWGVYVGDVSPESRAYLHFVSDAAEGAVDLETSLAAVRRQLPATLERLAAIAPVVVLAAPPDLRAELPRAVARGLEFRTSLAEHRAEQRPVAEALAAVAAREPRVAVLDPADLLCASDPCAGIVDGVFVYQDDNHVTAQGALLFRDELLRRLGAFSPPDGRGR